MERDSWKKLFSDLHKTPCHTYVCMNTHSINTKEPGMIHENTNIPANIKIIESTNEFYMGFERAKNSQRYKDRF